MIKYSLDGWEPENKSEEKAIQFDLNEAKDDGTPATLKGALREFTGKIQ